MRTRYPLLILLMISFAYTNAQNIKAGDITFKLIGDLQVEATVTLYTKISGTSSLSDRDSIAIAWGDGNFSAIIRLNGSINGNGLPNGVMVAPDIKKSIYKGIHAYAGVHQSNPYFVISFVDQNRIPGINNINGGNSAQFPYYLEAVAYVPATLSQIGLNSSPAFIDPPCVYYAQVNDTFKFNSVAYDADMDSMTFQIIPPKINTLHDVPFYSYPDQYCRANGQLNSGLILDTKNGQITWIAPCTQGLYEIAYLVKEYKCGLLIGTVMQDMQIIVLPTTDHMPVATQINDTIIQPGQTISYDITATDADVSQAVTLQMSGGAFFDQQNAPVFQSTVSNPATGTFTWQPVLAQAGEHAHVFSVKALDNYTMPGPDGPSAAPIADCRTFRVWVADTTTTNCLLSGINELPVNDPQLQIFPNPSANQIHVSCGEQINGIQIMDMTGKEVMTEKYTGNDIEADISKLANGVYLISVSIAERTYTLKFIKTPY